MRLVLDTNVLVSALLSPYGQPAKLVTLVAAGEVRLCYDRRIIGEYREVLQRSKFAFDPADVRALLDQIEGEGELVAAMPLARRLPDPDDEMFLEVAAAGRADHLVTGNFKHYPAPLRLGVRVVSPAAFLADYRRRGE